MSTEIVKVEAPAGLAKEQVNAVKEAFLPHIEAMGELEPRYQALTAEKLIEPTEEQVKEARAIRLAYVKTRTGTAKTHKELKADALLYSRYLDGFKKTQEVASSTREADMLEIEKHWENIEKERVAKLQSQREELLEKLEVSHFPANLGEMEEDVWESYYEGVYKDYKRRKEDERIAEEQRVAKEKAESEEREKQRLETERLKKEAAEREAKLYTLTPYLKYIRDLEAIMTLEGGEFEKAVSDLAAEAMKAEAALREKEEADRKERERLENIQKQQAAKLKVEQEERERLQREKDECEAKEAADEKRKQDKNHRDSVDDDILVELTDLCGLHEEVATDILNKIKAGKIPHVTINY